MVIGITGTDGAGKGAVVEYLQTKGFAHYSVRALITKEILKRGLEVHRPHMREVANDMRAIHGGSVMVHMAAELAKEESIERYVVESLRAVEEIELLHKNGGVLLAIDADQKIRYDRIQRRGSETDNITFEQFVEQEDIESKSFNTAEQNKRAVMDMADHTFMNDGSIQELHAKVEEWLQTLEK
jgi:dephospho-CoA kinase